MLMELGQLNCDEPIKLVEKQFQLRKLPLVKMGHVEHFCYSHKCLESELLVSENKEKESCNKVHALAILYLRIEEGISLQNIVEYFRLNNVPQIVE
jgi:hypothetical protein